MLSEKSTRKKRNTPANSMPVPDDDHRKRRRNRTTQSCINCHASKRMCDRKRPACARCTQLGLTGLCMYEVDDPAQGVETQDDNSRLLRRVAELEGVIRELKNKPHPRWVQASSPGEEIMVPHHSPCFQASGDESSPSSAPSPPISSSSSEPGNSSPRESSINIRLKSPYPSTSPGSTPSSSVLMTPISEYPFPHVDNTSVLPLEQDLTTILSSYPGLMEMDDFQVFPQFRPRKLHNGHCGCLHDSTRYTAILELSLRLRKASNVLEKSHSHGLGRLCPLRQRLSELDSFTMNALSNTNTSSCEGADSGLEAFHAPQIQPTKLSMSRALPVNDSVRLWNMLPPDSHFTNPSGDSFMTWHPSSSR